LNFLYLFSFQYVAIWLHEQIPNKKHCRWSSTFFLNKVSPSMHLPFCFLTRKMWQNNN
jgi:hypothetical protein